MRIILVEALERLIAFTGATPMYTGIRLATIPRKAAYSKSAGNSVSIPFSYIASSFISWT
jgi:hypothetical protein